MSVGDDRPFDIVLASDDETTPTMTVGLMLHEKQTGTGKDVKFVKSWNESRQPPLSAQYFTGPLSSTSKSPMQDLEWSQKDWSGGALEAVYTSNKHNFYAQADSIDARGKNFLVLFNKLNGPMDFIIRNPSAELGATTGWTATGTMTVVTTAPRTGTYHFKLASAATNDLIKQSITNPEVYQSRAITIYAYARRSGGTSASARVNIVDSAGTTNGAAVVLTTSYQQISVTRTINSAATTLRIEAEVSAQVGNPDVYFDDFFCIPTGGLVINGWCQGPEELVYNGEAEINTITNWTLLNGGNLTSDTTPYEGSRSWRLTNSTQTESAYQTVSSPTSYQGKTVVFTAWTKRGTVADNARLFIADSAGTTNSAANTSSTYTQLTVSRVIDSTATYVRLGIEKVDSGGGGAFAYFDQLQAYSYTPVDANPLYIVAGRCILKWDATNSVFDVVYIDSAKTFTSIIQYNQKVVAAIGNGDNAYVFGSGTGWAPSVQSGDAKFAHFFTVSRSVLWKSRFDGNGQHAYIGSSSTPFTGGSWSSEYTVGDLQRAITSLSNVNDVIVVGKEDGMHVYNRVVNDFYAADVFFNATNEYAFSPSSENFARTGESKGWLYLSASQQSLFRYNARQLQDVSSLLISCPRLTDFGGRVRAFAQDASGLYLLLDTPTADTSATKYTWLMHFHEDSEGLHFHTLDQVSIGDINGLMVNGAYLWAFGRLYDSTAADYMAAIYRWDLPTKTRFMALDPSPLLAASGTINFPMIDFGTTDDDKAAIRVAVLHDGVLDANHTLVVKYGLNGAAPTTSTLGTLNTTGRTHNLFFDTISAPETNATFKTIQLQLGLTSNNTVSPKVYSIALHAILRADRIRTFELMFDVASGVMLNNGQIDPLAKKTVISNLKTLEAQDYPIRMSADFDLDGVLDENKISCIIVPGSLERVPSEEYVLGGEVWKVMIQEVITA